MNNDFRKYEVMKNYPGIKVVTLESNWKLERAQELMKQYLDKGGHADGVFGHRDVYKRQGYRCQTGQHALYSPSWQWFLQSLLEDFLFVEHADSSQMCIRDSDGLVEIVYQCSKQKKDSILRHE